MVRKRLARYCRKCDKRYIPTGKYQWVCVDCQQRNTKRATERRIVTALENNMTVRKRLLIALEESKKN